MQEKLRDRNLDYIANILEETRKMRVNADYHTDKRVDARSYETMKAYHDELFEEIA